MFLLDFALRVKHFLSFIMSSDILLELIDYGPVIVKQFIVPCLEFIMKLIIVCFVQRKSSSFSLQVEKSISIL